MAVCGLSTEYDASFARLMRDRKSPPAWGHAGKATRATSSPSRKARRSSRTGKASSSDFRL